MWYPANSSKNLFTKEGKLASLQIIALSIVAKLISQYLPSFFFLTKNQVFRYNPFKSSKTSLSKQSYTIFITSKTNAQGNRKFGACYALCKIVFKITKKEISSWNHSHSSHSKEITSSQLSIILSNNTLFFGRSISPISRLASLFEVSRVLRGIAKNRGKSKCWYSSTCYYEISQAFKCSYQLSLPPKELLIPLALFISCTFLAFDLYIIHIW